MHYVSDIQIFCAAGVVVVHFIVSTIIGIITVRRAAANGRGIERNHEDIMGVDTKSAAIAAEVVLVRASLGRIQAHLDGTATRGTRATDIPGRPPARSAMTPNITGAEPGRPGVWTDPRAPRPIDGTDVSASEKGVP